MSSCHVQRSITERGFSTWVKAVWIAQLSTAVGVTAWASWVQPEAKYAPDWTVAMRGTLLIAAFLLARRGSDLADRSRAEIPIVAAWSLALAALALSAAGHWSGAPLWQPLAVAVATTLPLIIHQPFGNEHSVKDHEAEHRR